MGPTRVMYADYMTLTISGTGAKGYYEKKRLGTRLVPYPKDGKYLHSRM